MIIILLVAVWLVIHFTHTCIHNHALTLPYTTLCMPFRQASSEYSDIAVRANVAYGEVNPEPEGEPDLYVVNVMVMDSVEEEYEIMEPPAAEEFPLSQPVAPVYETAGEITEQQHTSEDTAM